MLERHSVCWRCDGNEYYKKIFPEMNLDWWFVGCLLLPQDDLCVFINWTDIWELSVLTKYFRRAKHLVNSIIYFPPDFYPLWTPMPPLTDVCLNVIVTLDLIWMPLASTTRADESGQHLFIFSRNRTRPPLSQIWSFKIRLAKFIKPADLRISRL